MNYLIESRVGDSFRPPESASLNIAAMGADEEAIWAWLGGGHAPRRFHVEDDSVWGCAAVVDESRRSQFDLLVELARSASPPDAAFASLALTGSGFHGNRGRAWVAMRGNLHFSSYCPLNLDAALCGPALSMLPTVAVIDVITSLPDSRAIAPGWIKWVNDVYLGDGKVSGSLVSSQIDGDRIVSCVLGVGMNVTVTPELGDESSFGPATCLREHGIEIGVPDLFARLLAALSRRITQLGTPAGPDELFLDYRRRLGGVGQRVEIHEESRQEILATGTLLDVHRDLSLEIEGAGRVDRGRLRFAESP